MRDVLLEKSVEMEATRLFVEPASSETENRYFVRGFMRGASGESENR